MNIFQRWKQTALHNKALVLTGVIVAVGTLVYTGAAVFQYCLMKQAAKENSEQLDKIISEAKSIATSAKNSLEQSKRALDESIEISRRDQRAWVMMTEVTPEWRDANGKPLFIKEGARYHIGVTIFNSGRTPALKVSSKMKVGAFPENSEFVPYYENVTTNSIGVLPPQAKLIAPSLPSIRVINASDIASLKNGSQILYLYGEIKYEDIFGIQHQTTYCSKLATTLDIFLVNSTYNDAN